MSGRVSRAMSWAWFRMVVSWAARVGSGGVVSEGGWGCWRWAFKALEMSWRVGVCASMTSFVQDGRAAGGIGRRSFLFGGGEAGWFGRELGRQWV